MPSTVLIAHSRNPHWAIVLVSECLTALAGLFLLVHVALGALYLFAYIASMISCAFTVDFPFKNLDTIAVRIGEFLGSLCCGFAKA